MTKGDYPALPRSFFDRPTRVVARRLLGALLAHRTCAGWRVGRIVETEAYLADDPASHSFSGPTPRNRSMFARPGTLYVYRIHQVVCANAVTRTGEAVLLRAAEPWEGPVSDPRGPGRLCRALGITLVLDGSDLVEGPVRLARGCRRPGERVLVGRRIGIRRAVDWPLRYALDTNPWVSLPRPPDWRADRPRSLT